MADLGSTKVFGDLTVAGDIRIGGASVIDTINAGDNTAVKLTGNQTVAGVKTFSSTITGSVSGNAATATKLATASTIAGVAFDGSANITLTAANVGATSRDVYVGEGFRDLGPIQSLVGSNYLYRWYKLCQHTTSTPVDTTFDIIVSADKNYAGSSGRYYVSVSRYEGSGDPVGSLHVSVNRKYGAPDMIELAVKKEAGGTTVWVRGKLMWGNIGVSVINRGTDGGKPTFVADGTFVLSNDAILAGTVKMSCGNIFDGDTGALSYSFNEYFNRVHDSGSRVYSPVNKPTAADVGALQAGDTAVAATKLATARTIAGVDFDGTANINLPGVNTTGNQSTTGNAATATKLATARTIAGVSFDGTANISLTAANVGAIATTGGTATGSITAPDFIQSSAQSTNAAACTRKDYVDSAIATGDALQVSKSGDTMTGDLTAPAILVSSTQNAQGNALTRKDYVDGEIAKQVSKTGDTMTGNLTAPAVLVSSAQNTSSNALTRKDYVDGEIAKQVAKTGGTMTGTLTVPKSRGLATAAGADGSYTCISGEGTYTMMWRMNGSTTKADEFIGIDSASRLIFRKDRGLGDKTWDDYSVYHQGFKPTAAEIGALQAGATAVAATKLATARTIAGVDFDGTANITLTAANVGALQAGDTAVAATKLATARTIAGVDFDGTANITLTAANVGALQAGATAVSATKLATARTLTVGGTGKAFDGDGNVAWSLAEIGAARARGELASGATENITTDQFVQWLKDSGAFDERVWIARGSWKYANNKTITDTGCGNIHLAGCTIEVISGSEFAFTIRIITPTTTSGGGTTGAEFVYVNNGPTFAPGWRRIYTTAWKPTSGDVGLGNVQNWGATSAVNDASDAKYATAGAVKKAYDLAAAALPADSNAVSATKLLTARTISTTGDATGSADFDGTANAAIALTLANSGVTAGTYGKVTVDAKGRVTAGMALVAADIPSLDWSKITSGKPTTLAGYGITDAAPSSHVGATGAAHGAATASVAGFMSAADKAKLDGIAASANNYSHPTGDGNLHVPATGTTNNAKFLRAGATAGSLSWASLVAADIPSLDWSKITTGKPTTLAGYGITDALGINANAVSATKLETARTITFTGDSTGSVSFDGTADVTINLVGKASGVAAGTYRSVTVDTQGYVTGGTNPTTLAGYGITDALGINATAVSATKLTTARTIGGVAFDGTANINLPGVNTAGNQSTTGNAATATKLATARTIAGVSFDGTANISLTAANVGAAPSGYGLGTYGTGISTVLGDCNLRRQSGFFQGSNIAGIPNGTGWTYLFNQAHGNAAGYFGYLAISFAGTQAWIGGQEGGTQKGPYELVKQNDRFVAHNAVGSDYNQCAIEVNGNTAIDSRPGIGFHMSNRFASTLHLWEGGDFRFHTQGLTSYAGIMTGNVNANDVYIRSDRRLKKNLVEVRDALRKVSSLTAYSYDKKQTLEATEYDKKEVGLIAQDVEQVLPEAVTRVVDSSNKDGTEILTLSNSALIALLVGAVKELTDRVKYLESKIN